MTNDVEMLRDYANRVERGDAIGPRITKAGFLDGPGPFGGPANGQLDACAPGPISCPKVFYTPASATCGCAPSWAALTPQLAIGILLTQRIVSPLGGHNVALRGRPGLAEQQPVEETGA